MRRDEAEAEAGRHPLPRWGYTIATTAHVFTTTLGMTSLGLFAMLITHHKLSDKSSFTRALADGVTFSTAIMGKIAIVLFLNLGVFKEKLNKLWNEGFHSFFIFPKENLERLGWVINYLLSLNASLFWAGLVQIGFVQSAALLATLDSEVAKAASEHIGQWYVFVWFVLSSFYSNWLVFPAVHQASYHQSITLTQWFLERRGYRNLKECVHFRLQQANQALLSEHKKNIDQKGNVPKPITPHLNSALQYLISSGDIQTNSLETLSERSEYFINQAKHSTSFQLQKAYLVSDAQSKDSLSTIEWAFRQVVALFFMALTIWGFQNIVRLSHAVWEQWGMSFISTYGAAHLSYFSMSLTIALTVYPMIYNLTSMIKHGIPSHILSSYTHGFIGFMVIFVGVFGGLANAEQSDLAGESTSNIVIAVLASFILESFVIYRLMRSFFEWCVKVNLNKDNEIILKQHYLELQELSGQVCDTSSITENELLNLALDENVRCGMNLDETVIDRVGKKFNMFYFFEEPLRRFFNVEYQEENKLIIA